MEELRELKNILKELKECSKNFTDNYNNLLNLKNSIDKANISNKQNNNNFESNTKTEKYDNFNNNYNNNYINDNDEELNLVLEISKQEYISSLFNNNTNNKTKKNIKIKNKTEITEYEPNGIQYPYAKIYYYKCDKYFYGKHDHSNNCHCGEDYNAEEIKKISKMKCMFCNTVQNINKNCINCKKQLANYYCNICNIISNYPIIRHCNKCKKCKGTNIPNADIIHCDKCNNCVYRKHNCDIISKNDSECVICQRINSDGSPYGDYKIKNTLKKLDCCGNVFHYNCLNELNKHGRNKCPLCRKEFSM